MIMRMIHLVQATNLASKTPDGRFGSRHKVGSFCFSGAQSGPDFTFLAIIISHRLIHGCWPPVIMCLCLKKNGDVEAL
jgi:hypothetical protein